jgi:hypothetical protein
MSWAVNATGQRGDVRDRVVAAFDAAPKMQGVEEELRQKAKLLAFAALDAQPNDKVPVTVECHGSAFTIDGKQQSNSVHVSVVATS